MRIIQVAIVIYAVLVCVCASPQIAPKSQATNTTGPTPLILEKNEGERRVWKMAPGNPLFILKVDPKNGGSSHLVLGTEDLKPGDKIPAHRHPGSDEILLLQSGTASVLLGATTKEVHGGTTVFIPANTWISVANVGNDNVSLTFIFSAPGFEEFMRDSSVREGEKIIPPSKEEMEANVKKHSHAVIYQ